MLQPSTTKWATASYMGLLRVMTASKLSLALSVGRPASMPEADAAKMEQLYAGAYRMGRVVQKRATLLEIE